MSYLKQVVGSIAFLCVLSITVSSAVAGTAPSVPGIAQAQDQENIDPRDLQMLAILYIENNQASEAIPLLERSIDLYPENGETYMWLGVAQTFTDQFALAEESLMKALARNPALTDARNYLGLLRYKEGDLQAAVNEYLACIADPVYPPVSKSRVRYNLGNVYMEMGDIEAAREQFAASAATVSTRDQLFPPLNVQLAKALKELGRTQEAIAALVKVTEVDELNVEAHLELGLAYRDLSQKPAAQRHLQTVIDIAPGTDASARAQAALARLQG